MKVVQLVEQTVIIKSFLFKLDYLKNHFMVHIIEIISGLELILEHATTRTD